MSHITNHRPRYFARRNVLYHVVINLDGLEKRIDESQMNVVRHVLVDVRMKCLTV